MTPKQARFVEEYLKDLNAAAAARRAGYGKKRADQAGYQALSNSEVAAEIQRRQAERLASNDLTATRTLEEMRRLAFGDMRRMFNKKGDLKPIHELSDEEAATLSSVEIVRKNLTAGDGSQEWVHKIRVWDKPRSLEMLAKHFGLLVEKIDAKAEIVMKWQE